MPPHRPPATWARRCANAVARSALVIALAACGGGGSQSVDDEASAGSTGVVPPALEGRDLRQGPIDRGGGMPPVVGTRTEPSSARERALATPTSTDPHQIGRFTAAF